jgi:hypothetical protein
MQLVTNTSSEFGVNHGISYERDDPLLLEVTPTTEEAWEESPQEEVRRKKREQILYFKNRSSLTSLSIILKQCYKLIIENVPITPETANRKDIVKEFFQFSMTLLQSHHSMMTFTEISMSLSSLHEFGLIPDKLAIEIIRP